MAQISMSFRRLTATDCQEAENKKARQSELFCFDWLGYEDSNLGMVESESTALPLGDTPKVRLPEQTSLKLAGVRGFEPRNGGIRIHCLTAWRYPNKSFLV